MKGEQSPSQKDEKIKSHSKGSLQSEFKQIINELQSKNISKENIKETLNIYKNFLEKIDSGDIEKLDPLLGTENLVQFFNKKLKKFGMDEQSAEILAQQDFDGQLFIILGDEDKRKEFFDQLDQTIEEGTRDNNLLVSDTEFDNSVKKGTLVQEELTVDESVLKKIRGVDNNINEKTSQREDDSKAFVSESKYKEIHRDKRDDEFSTIESQSDISSDIPGDTSDSDSSAAQGSTSSGKLTNANFINFSKNAAKTIVSMSDVETALSDAQKDDKKIGDKEKSEVEEIIETDENDRN
jgi:hypothetical protein